MSWPAHSHRFELLQLSFRLLDGCRTRFWGWTGAPFKILRARKDGTVPGGGLSSSSHRQPAHLPIPEIARRGRTLRAWQHELLAYFDTDGASKGPLRRRT